MLLELSDKVLVNSSFQLQKNFYTNYMPIWGTRIPMFAQAE